MQVESVNAVEALPTQGKKPPKVSVCVVTYNQEKYIAQCLQSIVDQKTDFDFEIIVGDDCSTDRTAEIIKEYARKYSTIIQPVFRKKNIGPTNNYFDVVNRCMGDYVSHIDGDDLMLPGKLKNQALILDDNPNISFVVHSVINIDEFSSHVAAKEVEAELKIYKQSDLLKLGCFFVHSSKMYRRSAIMTRQSEVPIVDYYLHLEHSHIGDIAYIKQSLGAYRVHGEGISKSFRWRKLILEAYDNAFNRALELGVDPILVSYGRIRHRQAIALSALKKKDYQTFCEFVDIPADFKCGASIKQKLLSATSRAPRLVSLLHSIKMAIT